MTEQELREKIANTLEEKYKKSCKHKKCKECVYSEYGGRKCLSYLQADALIATGIGDVKEVKFESDHFWRMWQGALVELERAERRAKVAERALQIADELGELCGRKEDYVQQAEKELAEGAK